MTSAGPQRPNGFQTPSSGAIGSAMPTYKSIANVHLTGLARDLAARAQSGKPIRIGVIGSGEMGTDLVTQGSLMQGVEVVAISTRRPHTAREAMNIAFGDESS